MWPFPDISMLCVMCDSRDTFNVHPIRSTLHCTVQYNDLEPGAGGVASKRVLGTGITDMLTGSAESFLGGRHQAWTTSVAILRAVLYSKENSRSGPLAECCAAAASYPCSTRQSTYGMIGAHSRRVNSVVMVTFTVLMWTVQVQRSLVHRMRGKKL